MNRTRILSRFSRRSTGFKLFLALSLALLPLAAVAFLATLQSTRTADLENQAEMRIALNESSRKLAAALASDISAIRIAMEALDVDPEDPSICARLSSIMTAQGGSAAPFAIYGTGSQPTCASAGVFDARPAFHSSADNVAPRTSIENDALRILVPGTNSTQIGRLIYSQPILTNIARPVDFPHAYALSIDAEGGKITLAEMPPQSGLAGNETLAHPVGITGLSLGMTVARESFTTAEIISILLPVLMWAAAAAIGWLVVDRVLIRPLRSLEREVSAYQPGTILNPRTGEESAEELRQLGDTFRTITQMIASHEAALAEGLAKQTRLTREVHHRVKNNLQVIASLINLHARSAESAAVAHAYASIQRRVDALSVVHRNHFAEVEESSGVELRKLIGELAQNLRGSFPEGEIAPLISLDLAACYCTQDVAVPVAFLLTELVELGSECDPGEPFAFSLILVSEDRALLSTASASLVESEALDIRLADRFGRVLQGLSRQLRSPLHHDKLHGIFSLEIPVTSLVAVFPVPTAPVRA